MNQLNTINPEGFNLLPYDGQGWNSKHPIFEQLIAQAGECPTVVEVGSWKGASAITMCQAYHKLHDAAENALPFGMRMYCVDTWLGAAEFWTTHADTPERNLNLNYGYPQVYYQFLSNIIHAGLQDTIIPVPMPSTIGAKVLKHNNVTADLIYIDASHEYEDVRADIAAYLPLLKTGGTMFGDDWAAWVGVQQAVIEAFGYTGIDIIDNNFWIYKKP